MKVIFWQYMDAGHLNVNIYVEGDGEGRNMSSLLKGLVVTEQVL